MGKKITVKWQGESYEARYQVDVETGAVKDLNRQRVDRDDVKTVVAHLHGINKSEIARIVQKKYFG